MIRPIRSWMTAIACLVILENIPASVIYAASDSEDLAIAKSLADMLFAGEAVVSKEQDRINDPKLGDKGLNGAALIEHTREIYRTTTGVDPATIDPASRQGRLLHVQMDAIVGGHECQSADDQRNRDRVSRDSSRQYSRA